MLCLMILHQALGESRGNETATCCTSSILGNLNFEHVLSRVVPSLPTLDDSIRTLSGLEQLILECEAWLSKASGRLSPASRYLTKPMEGCNI